MTETDRREIGIAGVPGPIARHALERGVRVVVAEEAGVPADAGYETIASYAGFMEALDHPRTILMEVPPGDAIDTLIDVFYVQIEPGDVVVDATTSYWGDTLRRWRRMKHRSLFYVDAAVVGDGGDRPWLLTAGDDRALALTRATFDAAAGEDRVIVAGEAGAAHFARLVLESMDAVVHQALDEGTQLLEAFPGSTATRAILDLWYRTPAAVHPDGEGAPGWIADDALKLEVPAPLIAQALMLRLANAIDNGTQPAETPRLGPFVHRDDLA